MSLAGGGCWALCLIQPVPSPPPSTLPISTCPGEGWVLGSQALLAAISTLQAQLPQRESSNLGIRLGCLVTGPQPPYPGNFHLPPWAHASPDLSTHWALETGCDSGCGHLRVMMRERHTHRARAHAPKPREEGALCLVKSAELTQLSQAGAGSLKGNLSVRCE